MRQHGAGIVSQSRTCGLARRDVFMDTRRRFRTGALGLGIALAFSAFTVSDAAAIGSANALCPAAADPCRVDTSGLIPVTDGATLDFGSRTLEIARGGLDAGSGSFAIHAGAVIVRSHGRLQAVATANSGGAISVLATGSITVEAGAGDAGEIDVTGASGGTILLQAGTAVTIAGQVRADGLAQDGDGGLIAITAGSLTTGAAADIRAVSGRFGAGGTFNCTTTADIQMDGDVETTGGSGFGSPEVTIHAGGSLRIGGAIEASGTLDDVEGDGGSVTLHATGGEVSVGGAVDVKASTAGYAGSVDIDAAGPVNLRAPITATGGAPDGSGGDVGIRADGTVEQTVTTARIDAGASGIGSSGGSVTILARGGAVLRGIDASGGADGGDVTVLADVSLRVVGPIDVDGFGGSGLAGSVDLRTSGAAALEGSVHADAPPGELGGVVTVLACAASLSRGGMLSAAGTSGLTLIAGDATVTVAGRLQAGAENRLVTSGRGSAPLVTGTASPAPNISVDPTIVACGQTVATTSTTTTTTRTTATRTTTTQTSTSTTSTSPSTSTTTSSTATTSSTTSTTTTNATTTVTAPSTTSISTSTTTTTSSSTTSTTSTSTTASPTSSTTTTTSTSTPGTTSTTESSAPTTTAAPTTSTTLPTACDDLDCDDGDPCSIDTCSDGACNHALLANTALLACRIAAVHDAVAVADFSRARKLRVRLDARVEHSQRLIATALGRDGTRRVRPLKQAIKQIAVLRRDVERAGGRGLLDAADVGRIRAPIQAVATWLDLLQTAARRAP